METAKENKIDAKFKDDVSAMAGGENVKLCFACGTCTAACPVAGVDPDFNPRRIIRQILFGERHSVLSSPAIWLCLQCYACYATCPQNVKFRDVVKALRAMAVAEGHVKPELAAEAAKLDDLMTEARGNLVKSLLSDKANYEAGRERIKELVKK